MLKLPDVIQIGPIPLPTFPFALMLGYYLTFSLSGRGSEGRGVERAIVEHLLGRFLIGGLVGAKLVEVLRSPASYAGSPRLLLSVPAGFWPLFGLLCGGAIWAALAFRGRWRLLPSAFDVMALPGSLGLALASLGVGDDRTLILVVGFLAVAAALQILQKRALFPGHEALAAVVMTAFVLVAADFARPAATLFGGLTLYQLTTAAVGGLAYGAARYFSRFAQ